MDSRHTSEYIRISADDGFDYTMFTRLHDRFGVDIYALAFEPVDCRTIGLEHCGILEIETKFNSFVNESFACDMEHITSILRYVEANQQQVRDMLCTKIDERSAEAFLNSLATSFATYDIENAERKEIRFPDIPLLSHGTANKRFFLMDNIYETFKEVSLTTAMAIAGDQTIINHCKQLDFLSGIGINGKAMWCDGVAIQDIHRDYLKNGFCR